MALRLYGIDRIWYAEPSATGKRVIYDADTLADRPSSAAVGEKCYCSETGTTYQWDGDSWESMGGGLSITTVVNTLYPIGSIYLSTLPTNPSILLGAGTWVSFGAGRALVGVDAGDPDFDTAEETGGAKTHTLTIDEMPPHQHDEYVNQNTTGGIVGFGGGRDTSTNNGVVTGYTTGLTGGGQAHSNLQPFICIYAWKRTA